jgi:hypothetical protein
MKVKMAYAYPDRLIHIRNEFGEMIWVRVPNHPTRSARDTDSSTWWEERKDNEPQH